MNNFGSADFYAAEHRAAERAKRDRRMAYLLAAGVALLWPAFVVLVSLNALG